MKTRKDFVAMAKVIREIKSPQERARLTVKFGKQFAADNPRFDNARWRTACGYSLKQKGRYNFTGKTVKQGWFSDFISLKHI
jgi:hypothetical protein